jgi:hypothetical protein
LNRSTAEEAEINVWERLKYSFTPSAALFFVSNEL